LFPTKEDLFNKLGKKIANATQLLTFVRNLKEDLNEQKVLTINKTNLKSDLQIYIQTLGEELVKAEGAKPYYDKEDFDLSCFNTELQKKVSDLLSQLLHLKDPIDDVIKGNGFGSNFVALEEFDMIREWLQRSADTFNPKLLYSVSRDGFSILEFHKCCDGRKNTITLAKVEWEEGKTYTIGGYLDQPWHAKNQYIESCKSFIFSTTTKSKAGVVYFQYGAYGGTSQGPSFGNGFDLSVMSINNNTQGYMNQAGYAGTKKLIGARNYSGSGQSFFKTLEIEVYTLD